MCVAKGSAKGFVECDVSEHPFGVGLFLCENPICPYAADCIEVCNYNSRVVCFFRCPHCGMTYKKTKAKSIKGIPVILDYGHIWIDELKRCVQNKTMTNAQMEEILKFDIGVITLQKKKLGLLRSPKYDTALGPEAYYKGKVLELYKQYGELTFSLLQEKLPGAYEYLDDNYREWLRKHIVHMSDTEPFRRKREELLHKVIKALDTISIEEGLPNRQISYSYIADVAGVTRDDLRSNKHIRKFLADVLESKEDWYRRRITYVYQNLPVESRDISAFQICRKANIWGAVCKKYREFFEEVVNELKANNEKL